MNYKVLGVAGGNGVILHPFKDNLIGNIETRGIFKTPDDVQWRLNFKAPLFKIPTFDKNLKPDLIVGAPDCGHSSVLAYSRAKTLSNPSENESLNNFIKSVLFYKPSWFMMENLPKLLDHWDKEIKDVFADYNLTILTSPVSAWGNSQVSRVRLIVIGEQKNLIPQKFKIFRVHNLKTSGELIEGLDEEDEVLCNVREPMDTDICLYYKNLRKISAARAQRLWMGKFKKVKRWPVFQGRLTNQPGVYRNFESDFPLTVRKQNRQFNHNGLMLTPREIARIQGIPDDFKLWHHRVRSGYSINKARVTTAKTAPYEIGQWLYTTLNQYQKNITQWKR